MWCALFGVILTSTIQFMEKMVVQYEEQAKEAGVYIVSACGHGCIPNDLGALVLQRNFEGELAYVESYMTTDGVSFVTSVLKGHVN